MILKPPGKQGSSAKTANDLQREVAARVTQRWEEKHRKEVQAARMASIKNYVSLLILLVMAGGGFYAWKIGYFDQWLGSSAQINVAPSSCVQPTSSKSMSIDRGEAKVIELPKAPEVQRDCGKQLDYYTEVVHSFRDVVIDYWKNAPDSDRPHKAGKPLTYRCLLADEQCKPLILELYTDPVAKMKAKRVSASVGLVDFPLKDFNSLIKKSPYLISIGRRAYVAESNGQSGQRSFSLPASGEVNPSKMMFGSLYDIMYDMKVSKPSFKYSVKFESKGDSNLIDVATVGFGENVHRKTFETKIADRYGLDVTSDAMAIDAVIRMGRVKIETL